MMGWTGRLIAWCIKLDDKELLSIAAKVALDHRTHPERLSRVQVEQVRDRLDRAQERFQFSSEEDQQDLANVVAELDQLLKTIPAN